MMGMSWVGWVSFEICLRTKEVILEVFFAPSLGGEGGNSWLSRLVDVGDREETVRRRLHCLRCVGDCGGEMESDDKGMESSSDTLRS